MRSRLAMTGLSGMIACALALLSAGGALARGRQLTAQDYARAEQFMPYNTQALVEHEVVRVHWLQHDRFWYLDRDTSGNRYRIMDASTGKVSAAFDPIKLAAALSALLGKALEPSNLSITALRLLGDGRLEITREGEQFGCDLRGVGRCVNEPTALASGGELGILSPDGRLEAFIRNWNLWVREVDTGKETELTFDGIANFGYATDDAGWRHSNRPVLDWSPDSKEIATYRQDQRQVGEMALVSARVGHPQLEQWKYPLPGDKHVFMIEPVLIDVATGKVVHLRMPPQQRLSSLCDDISCRNDGHWDDVQWAPDGKTLALVSTSRDRKHEWFRVANARTGAVRTVFEENVSDYFQSGVPTYYPSRLISAVDWRYLPASREAIWYSERNNWGNLYLYDLQSGRLEHPITTGSGDVTQVVRVDRKTRTVWFRAVGRTPGVNPYYEQLWKVGLDGGRPTLLTPEPCNHVVSISPDGKYFVDSCSTATQPPVTTLRDANDGRILATVAKADISRLQAIGWRPPQIVVVKGRDRKTDLYGLLFKPTNFDPHKKYPLIDYVYPGPQIGSVLTFSFLPARQDSQSLAELGFIVVAIDGMGTPMRSASFHHFGYGDMGDNTLPDQIAAIEELARVDPWIDLKHVGIWGHSGGGNTAADAMFRDPGFFKVGWAESGNYDNRDYENDWGEKYQGLLARHRNGTTNYDNQADELIASHLQGHLMLVYGTLDDNVPPENTQIVVQALIKADKTFDMIAIPNARHDYGYATPYITRRRWDYFVRYLAGDIPPPHYALKPWPWN